MKTSIMITKSVFSNLYSAITSPGSYIVKAGSSTRIYDEKLGKYKWIVNLKAIAADKIVDVKNAFGTKSEIDIADLNGLTLSANIIENEGQSIDIPMKNSEVKITVDFVNGRDGSKVLRVTNISVPPTVKASAFKFDETPELASSETVTKEEPKNVLNSVKSSLVTDEKF